MVLVLRVYQANIEGQGLAAQLTGIAFFRSLRTMGLP